MMNQTGQRQLPLACLIHRSGRSPDRVSPYVFAGVRGWLGQETGQSRD
ncbi:MAG: hypothetical protein KDI07_00915 [Anaerolineae bacterium]|nr:hypothetical protein [Anaerolineae bacterium]MCB9141002.1 hypothetical protein [Anaerolineales bacterium]